MSPTKNVIMVGGPNGAGKTSWALRYLANVFGVTEFINADEIARGLSPLNPEGRALEAGRLTLKRLDELSSAGESFAFETTCSGRTHLSLLKTCKESGYIITLVFLWLPAANSAVSRVARRVSEGGHRIPADTIVRRYAAGLRNMRQLYLPLADRALIYDNADGAGVLIADRQLGGEFAIRDQQRWSQIEETTR
jgi:predicted ABC-type ATPase